MNWYKTDYFNRMIPRRVMPQKIAARILIKGLESFLKARR